MKFDYVFSQIEANFGPFISCLVFQSTVDKYLRKAQERQEPKDIAPYQRIEISKSSVSAGREGGRSLKKRLGGLVSVSMFAIPLFLSDMGQGVKSMIRLNVDETVVKYASWEVSKESTVTRGRSTRRPLTSLRLK
ncbi:hypothetical protein BT69DRAFT_859409 [Atractiella rhizophila]|nr:hypothetical protein BT69DRAFT_859409 [Atractiella rhizophila]